MACMEIPYHFGTKLGGLSLFLLPWSFAGTAPLHSS